MCAIIKNTDSLTKFVRNHEQPGIGAFIFVVAYTAAEELGLQFEDSREPQPVDRISVIDLTPVQLKATVKTAGLDSLYGQHVDKPVHGLF